MTTLRSMCLLAVVLIVSQVRAAEENLLTNPDFSAKTDAGLPAKWSIGKGQKVTIDPAGPEGIKQSLRIDVTADGGSSYGQVYQTVKAKPGVLYRLQGQTKSSKANMAFFSIKLIKGGHEGKRIGLPKSKTDWSPSSLEFSSEDADEIQVLCRWEQSEKKGWVGQTCWFADVKLVEKGAAPPPPAWKAAIAQAASIQPVAAPALPLKPAAGDLHVTPAGAGKADGSDFANALPGSAEGVLQAAWDALAPGQSLKVGSGVYANVSLKIATGGTSADKPKRLVGHDTGAGLPWFVGNWQPSAPEKGATFLGLTDEVKHCAFENLQLARYQYGVFTRKGRHVGLTFKNTDMYEMRHGLYLNGMVSPEEADAASHDLTIQDCDFIHFTKSAVRLQGGNYDVRIINCVADAGGTEWMKEAFQICYNVSGDHPRKLSRPDEKPWASDHDILFINCVAKNAVWSKARYWQGDGFLAEGDIRNVAFINCSSFDNADGGWDAKASNVVYVNCVGMRNKMNFRVWHHGFFYNCLSANAAKHGGSWTGSGLWTTGDTRMAHSTLHNNEPRNLAPDKKKRGDAAEPDTGHVTLDRCINSADASAKTERLNAGDDAQFKKDQTIEWNASTDKDAAANDPQFVAAAQSKAWLGQPADAFDSKRFGPAQGYHSSFAATWRAKSPEELITIARALLKNKGWDDFKQQVEKFTAERK